ncbi:MAG: DUF1499 domain-containing protein [Gammaproteobacteria bacterium]|nr:DUF1499 domain-containing protein [Gammaproteobacteria bacterium]
MFSIIATAVFVLVLMYAALGWWSHQPRFRAAGLTEGRLAACPTSPNCVCSEPQAADDRKHSIEPIRLETGGNAMEWAAVVVVVREMGGRIETDSGNYLHAIFVSRIFRFVDDLELRADGESLQVRSASRVGYSDLGANRKRVESLRSGLRNL